MTARPGGGGNPPDARRVAQSMTTPEQAARLTAMAAEIRASLTATGVLAPVDPALAALMTRTTERPDLPPDPTTEEHPMLIATITTDPAGRLTDDSTCAINGRTVPVPLRVPHAGRLAPARICAAVRDLGYTTVDYYDTLRRFDGCVTVAVDAT